MNQKNEIMAFIYILLFILGISLFVYDIKNVTLLGSIGTVSLALWLMVFFIAKGWQMRTILSSFLALGYFSPLALTLTIKAIRNSYDFKWLYQTTSSAAEANIGKGYMFLLVISALQFISVYIFGRFKGNTTFKTHRKANSTK